jgi:hypothetical protein
MMEPARESQRTPAPSTQTTQVSGTGFQDLPAGITSIALDVAAVDSTTLRPDGGSLMSKATGGLEPDRSTTSSRAMDFVRSVLPLKGRDDFGSPNYTRDVCYELRKTMPERFNGELELIVGRLLEPDMEQIVKFAAERYIDKHLSFDELQDLLRVVSSTGYYKHLLSCLEVGGEVSRCLVKAVFEGALWNKNESLVRMALNYGADPNYRLHRERPLGLVSAEPGKSQLFLTLLDAGAEPDDTDTYRAAMCGNIALVERLFPRVGMKWPESILQSAASHGDTELYRSLVKLGVKQEPLPCDVEDHPLNLALRGYHFDLAEFLMQLGASNDIRISCLLLAIRHGDRPAAEFPYTALLRCECSFWR